MCSIDANAALNQAAKPDSRPLVSDYYDTLGIREWLRLASDPRARLIYEIHLSFLRKHLQPGWHVLDAGCGPGRFTRGIAGFAEAVVAGDISLEQLFLCQQTLRALGTGELTQFDVNFLPFADNAFDAVVCFGSVLSHTDDRGATAVQEIVRVIRPGGVIVLSVMSRGNLDLSYFWTEASHRGLNTVTEAILGDSDLLDRTGFPWSSFSVDELTRLARASGCTVLDAMASNVLATVENLSLLRTIEADADGWQHFLRWETHLAQKQGNLERGSHIIMALSKD